ncbi:putative neprosin [Tanacetum coccineum]
MFFYRWNECYDNEDELQSFRHKARQQDKVYDEREESCWILHLCTGIFYLKGHEGVMNEVPDGAAIFASSFKDSRQENEVFMSASESLKMKLVNARLKKINKPFVKSIKSPDGDIIDCVLFNLQPAFALPNLKGAILSMDPPELPKGYDNTGAESEIKQLWNSNGESCPNGTIPIRRTNASEILKSISISKFAKRTRTNDIPPSPGHEHAIGYVTPGKVYGAKARLNVWAPNVVGNDFSISQIWVIADVSNHGVNTVEAGWHVIPSMHKDNAPRLFIYWTPDGYNSGCYNLLCPGFVQISSRVGLGAAFGPVSKYNGQQYESVFMIWKDPRSGNWWLKLGSELIGYWPQTLFTDLRDHATTIEYGGEVYSENSGKHTSTQMGSGHFPGEGFGKAAYARSLEVVDQDNNLTRVSNLNLLTDKSSCYDVKNGYSDVWGNYIYFGGPGNNPNCP